MQICGSTSPLFGSAVRLVLHRALWVGTERAPRANHEGVSAIRSDSNTTTNPGHCMHLHTGRRSSLVLAARLILPFILFSLRLGAQDAPAVSGANRLKSAISRDSSFVL